MSLRFLVPFLVLPTLVGCASTMSGLNGSDRLSCPVTPGVTCKPMSQVYEESSKPAEPAQSEEGAAASGDTRPAPPRGTVRGLSGVEPGPVPLRTRPKVLRVWVTPWEDADGDLYPEGTWIAMRIDDGEWNVEHVRERIRDGYGAALMPPPASPEAGPAAKAKPASVAADVAEVLPKNLVPGSKAPAEPFFDSHSD